MNKDKTIRGVLEDLISEGWFGRGKDKEFFDSQKDVDRAVGIAEKEITEIMAKDKAELVEASTCLLSLCELEDKHGRLVEKEKTKSRLKQVLSNAERK